MGRVKQTRVLRRILAQMYKVLARTSDFEDMGMGDNANLHKLGGLEYYPSSFRDSKGGSTSCFFVKCIYRKRACG